MAFPRNAAPPVSRREEAAPALSPERKRELLVFLKQTRLAFKHIGLLNRAFTHRSAANESGHAGNNERLEFLGDSVLGAVTASLLYQRLPGRAEGDLAKIKSVVVSEEILAALSLELGIDRLLVLGKGEELSGGRGKKTILADALEALIGAVYLDGGFKRAWDFVSTRINPEISRALETGSRRDYKSLLQECTQRLYRVYPAYRLVKRAGPEHDNVFFIEVTVNGACYGPCAGRNKKSAEQEAARLACLALGAM